MSLYRRFFKRSRSDKHKTQRLFKAREPRSSVPLWRRNTKVASATRATAKPPARGRVAPKLWPFRPTKAPNINRLLSIHSLPKPIDFMNSPSIDLNRNRDRKKLNFCQRRKSRKQALFSLKIAGKGKRRSPGNGGTYKRTETSNLSCGA